jgi:hypothetical protein
VIVVLVEGGDSGSDVACPVFREIADGIIELENLSFPAASGQDGDRSGTASFSGTNE